MVLLSNKIRRIAATIGKVSAREGMLRAIDKFVVEKDMEASRWPAYVKKELYPSIKIPESVKANKFEDIQEIVSFLSLRFSSNPEVIKISTDLSNFGEKTRKDIELRIKLLGDTRYKVDVKDDTKRHEHQKKQYEEKSDKELINDEPVIVMEAKPGKYQLIEGWHRTIQLIYEARKRNLSKVNYKAYIGRVVKPKSLISRLSEILNKKLFS